jgi:hypothetical protein
VSRPPEGRVGPVVRGEPEPDLGPYGRAVPLGVVHAAHSGVFGARADEIVTWAIGLASIPPAVLVAWYATRQDRAQRRRDKAEKGAALAAGQPWPPPPVVIEVKAQDGIEAFPAYVIEVNSQTLSSRQLVLPYPMRPPPPAAPGDNPA